MYIEKQTVHGNEYIRLVENIVKSNNRGELKSTKKVIKTLGKLADLDDGEPNYLKRLRTSFSAGKPILAALEPYADGAAPQVIEVEFVEGTEDCCLERLLFAGGLLDVIFRELGLTTFLARVKSRSKIKYDLAGIVKLLVFGRLLNPRSKIATASQNRLYFVPPARIDKFKEKDVYKAMDVLFEQHEAILRAMHRSISDRIERDTDIVFYDVTNTFFQTDEPDEDVIDASGVCVQQGLRKYGKSKEGRHDPLVQIGLFMDGQGLPLAVEVFPGNVPDISTLRPMLEKTLRIVSLGKFLFVADRGICSNLNRLTLAKENAGYIVSKSILKSGKTVQDWILNDLDWIDETLDFRYKSKTVTTKVEDTDGVSHELREKIIVYWSRKYYEKQCAEHEELLEFLHSMEDENGGVPVERVQKAYVKKAFRKSLVVTDADGKPSGEMIPKSRLREIVDTEKLQHDVDLFGYYQIVTSETDIPDLDAIQIYKRLVKIETEFRDMKDLLGLRPVYVWTPKHIVAHIMLCFIALTIERLLQIRITQATPELRTRSLLWTWGMSGDRLRAALNNWQVIRLPGDCYAFSRQGSSKANLEANTDLDTLLHAFGIDIPLKMFKKGELKQIIRDIRVFC